MNGARKAPYRPVVLCVLDGWGIAPDSPSNAVTRARTPRLRALFETYPHATLRASGRDVGLPDGVMGNSEVGHLTMGAGYIQYQELVRINDSIEDGSFFSNSPLRAACAAVRGRGTLHLMGLISTGGVHADMKHLAAIVELARREKVQNVVVHAFLDGRDMPPRSALELLPRVPARIATVHGRYYAMDRDKRWDRVERSYRAIVDGDAPRVATAEEALRACYAKPECRDELLEPHVVGSGAPMGDGDATIFFNFRPDRARQLSEKLGELGVDLTTMTRYRDDFDFPVAFREHVAENTLAEVLAAHGIRQLHSAETEKYAHVTYFLDGGREEPFAGEERILVDSPRDVPSYDHKPEMSAREVADRVVQAIDDDGYGFVVVNFANPDMVGHTGVIPSVVQAVETADECLGRVVDAVERAGGVSLVIADHGNAENLLQEDGISPHTAHTTNPVPVIVTDPEVTLRDTGELSDLVPSVLDFLGFKQPSQMTGKPLTTSAV